MCVFKEIFGALEEGAGLGDDIESQRPVNTFCHPSSASARSDREFCAAARRKRQVKEPRRGAATHADRLLFFIKKILDLKSATKSDTNYLKTVCQMPF